MKKLGILLVTIVLTFACILGSVGCNKKERELKAIDYFEDKVTYGLFTTDATSEYYDASLGYGVLPYSENNFVYLYNNNPGYFQGLATDRLVQADIRNYTGLVFTPRTNIYEVELYEITFDVVTNIDCEFYLSVYETIGTLPVEGGGKISDYVNSKAGVPQSISCFPKFTWTEEEAKKSTWGERKKVEIVLDNEYKSTGVKWEIFNLKFILKKI